MEGAVHQGVGLGNEERKVNIYVTLRRYMVHSETRDTECVYLLVTGLSDPGVSMRPGVIDGWGCAADIVDELGVS